MTPMQNSSFSMDGVDADMVGSHMLHEYKNEIARLRFQNNQLLMEGEAKAIAYENVMEENQVLVSKLENLENVFIGQPSRRSDDNARSQLSQEYAESSILVENNELRRRVALLEQEKLEMKTVLQ